MDSRVGGAGADSSAVPCTGLAYGADFPPGEAALSAALSDRPGAAGGVMLNYSNCQRV